MRGAVFQVSEEEFEAVGRNINRMMNLGRGPNDPVLEFKPVKMEDAPKWVNDAVEEMIVARRNARKNGKP
jgi:hypothetical protein